MLATAPATWPYWAERRRGFARSLAEGAREVVLFIERHRLMGRGLGLIDVHLLASCSLAGTPLWTRDMRLAQAAAELRLHASI